MKQTKAQRAAEKYAKPHKGIIGLFCSTRDAFLVGAAWQRRQDLAALRKTRLRAGASKDDFKYAGGLDRAIDAIKGAK